MLDAIIFEKLGVPAAPIITRPFEVTCAALADLQAMPNYGYVVVDHPITSLDLSEVRERARVAAPYVEALLVEGVRWPDERMGVRSNLDDEADEFALGALVEDLAPSLRSDGADLTAEQNGPRSIRFTLHIPDQACADCIMPKDHLLAIFNQRTAFHLGSGITIDVVDPRNNERRL